MTQTKEAAIRNIRTNVLETALKMVKAGLVVAKEGNVSARVPGEDKIAITPSRFPYELMTANDILIVGFDEKIILGKRKPSTETKMHIAVFKARSDAGAVLHTHSPYASALSCVSGSKIPPLMDEQTVYLGGEVGMTQYAVAGSAEIAANAAAALLERDGTLLSNHGTICCGKTLDEALRNAILVEKLAQVYFLASSIGEVTSVPADIIEQQKLRYLSARQV